MLVDRLRQRFGKLRALRLRAPASLDPFRLYWRIYGGIPALLRSPYLWLAVAITAVCYPLWIKIDFFTQDRPSIDKALTIIPSLMAFSLGGVAVFMALSGRRFQAAIRQGGQEKSLFMQAVVALFHFLTVQSVALISALIAASYPESDFAAGLCFFLTAYSVTVALATAAVLLNVSRVFNVAIDDDHTA